MQSTSFFIGGCELNNIDKVFKSEITFIFC